MSEIMHSEQQIEALIATFNQHQKLVGQEELLQKPLLGKKRSLRMH